ncbi:MULTISPECIES: hypothetical protein [unclassified Mesorhizobium]|uniref:hypothetical protein n=1 Tax=unclassified Mesorhizobium TaxID=325217 RepID=UPI00121F4215|nr:hypothetical protein [Mesorhizobium sp.]TIL46457.1 MAG: hypothetical protein E5Y83_35025 [Mesorhizobium sp.]TIL84372.1 MAG: hypothetical protein E5Y73_33795 [Mesorhizobium sp.]
MNVETAPTATSRGVGHGDFGGDPGITDSDVSLSSDTDISRTAAASVYEAEVQPTDVLVFSDDPFPTEISAIIPSEPAVPEGNVVRQDPTVAFDNLFGTPGQTDIFVMEFTEVSPGAESNSAVINGYEPGIDKIAYVNQPEVGTEGVVVNWNFFRSSGYYSGLGVDNDPAIPDADQYSYASRQEGAEGLFAVPDAQVPLTDVFIYHDDPFLIA